MGLRDIAYKEDYRSGYDNIVEDFFRPSLRVAKLYWRAVGYFSSSALEAFGTPLGDFIRNGGQIKLVTSVELSDSDLKAIEDGAARQDVCTQRLEGIIESEFGDGIGDGVARLARLLEIGRLEIQIAVPKTGRGIYHEKIGLFIDGEDYVAFTGSSNESRTAFENNRECVDVYPSWDSAIRAERKRTHFETLWNRADRGVDVYSFPDAAQKKLLRVVGEWEAGNRQKHEQSRKWSHQDDAVTAFLKAKRGVLNMATGTGKTRTALTIIKRLFEQGDIERVIVTMDGSDLLNQWFSELLAMRGTMSTPPRVFRDYDDSKEVQDFSLSATNAILLVSRHGGTTRDPLVSALHELRQDQAAKTLLIHDEVHRLGSPDNRTRLASLSDQIRFRLGLSATPDREYDDTGNAFVSEHIGPELFRFDLRDAIRRGILAPFNYVALPYKLTPDDKAAVRDVYRRQSARAAAGEPMSDEQVWTEIAKVYKTSRAKLPVFANYIDANQDLLERCIVFVETQEYGHQVLDIIHRYRADFHTYFSGEQADTLKRFARGDLECLITCHRVSEGIDIRTLNSVILFSSARARLETIQRMGRCLRINPDNPSKVAHVVDFVRLGDHGDDPNVDEKRSEWLSELSTIRVAEE